MKDTTDQALHAAEQNMTDVLTLWANGRTSDLVFGEALKDMNNDGLKLVKAARKEREAASGQLLPRFAGQDEAYRRIYNWAKERRADAAQPAKPDDVWAVIIGYASRAAASLHPEEADTHL